MVSWCKITWSRDMALWRYRIKTLYFHFPKTYKNQLLHIGYLGWGVPSHKVLWALIVWLHNVKWEIRNVQSPLSEEQLPVNLAEWWLRVTRSHLLSQMSLFHVVTRIKWRIKNVGSPIPVLLWPPNFQWSRFRMRGPRLPGHFTTWLQGHMTNESFR